MYIFASKNNFVSNLLFDKLSKRTNEDWLFVSNKEYLQPHTIGVSTPDTFQNKEIQKIFFFHWSFIVPKTIYNKYECINIHTSNLPDGKGGSPLQNQIIDNIMHSRVNALRMSDDGLDAGPVYCSKNVTLQGNLNDIWLMLSKITYDLINTIIANNITPIPQVKNSDCKIYKRRRDNKIPFESNDILRIYDFIRMLDSEEYPNPFIKIGNYKLEFNRATFNGEKIHSDVIIRKIN